MISLEQLWLPIIVAAVLVFVASSLIHMVFKWHNSDYLKLPNEDSVRAAIRAANPPPGQYMIPHCTDPNEMKKPEVLQKFSEGPNAMLMLRPNGPPSMGTPLALWFGSNVVIALVVAYLASRTVPAGASYLAVCRVVGIASFLAYACGGVHYAIWFGKPWRSAIKEILDAFIYGLVSACAFAWLWPR